MKYIIYNKQNTLYFESLFDCKIKVLSLFQALSLLYRRHHQSSLISVFAGGKVGADIINIVHSNYLVNTVRVS